MLNACAVMLSACADKVDNVDMQISLLRGPDVHSLID